jgi:RimJ/RimL family protein N-acetyltransferase
MEAQSYELADGTQLIVREATQNDAGALMEFLPVVFEETDGLLMTREEFDKTLQEQVDLLGTIAASKTQLALVAHINEVLVGLLTFTGRDLERVRHTGEVGLIVAQKHWGLGVGKNMMKALHIWANANPLISKIDLRVRLSNRRAINLYESLGYQVEGWIRRAVKIDGEYDDHFWMGKELPF